MVYQLYQPIRLELWNNLLSVCVSWRKIGVTSDALSNLFKVDTYTQFWRVHVLYLLIATINIYTIINLVRAYDIPHTSTYYRDAGCRCLCVGHSIYRCGMHNNYYYPYTIHHTPYTTHQQYLWFHIWREFSILLNACNDMHLNHTNFWLSLPVFRFSDSRLSIDKRRGSEWKEREREKQFISNRPTQMKAIRGRSKTCLNCLSSINWPTFLSSFFFFTLNRNPVLIPVHALFFQDNLHTFFSLFPLFSFSFRLLKVDSFRMIFILMLWLFRFVGSCSFQHNP